MFIVSYHNVVYRNVMYVFYDISMYVTDILITSHIDMSTIHRVIITLSSMTNCSRGTLKDFDASVMAPSPALVARNLSFIDENVQVPPGVLQNLQDLEVS